MSPAKQRGSAVTRWRRIQFIQPAHQELLIVEPEQRGWLRPTENPEVSEFLRPDLTSCGYVDFVFPDGGPRWTRAVAISDKEVRVHYIGPWQKPKP